MTKTIKTIIIATIITAVIMISTAFALPASAEVGGHDEFYPKLAVVTAYEHIDDTDLWIIEVTDKDGEVWSFYGEEEDAHIGIMFNLLMRSIGEREEEDEIIEAYYEGCMDQQALMAWLAGDWR